MTSSRCVGVSTRISTELHVALCERAKGEGVKVSKLVAQLLEEKVAQVAGTEARPVPPSIPAEELATIQGRMERAERWISVLFGIFVGGDFRWSFEDVRCPGCGELGLEYFEGPEGARPRNGVRCPECHWSLIF